MSTRKYLLACSSGATVGLVVGLIYGATGHDLGLLRKKGGGDRG